MPDTPIRISLTEDDFNQLCCGRTLFLENGVELALQDIGLDRMAHLVNVIAEGMATPSCEKRCFMSKPHYGPCRS